MGASPNIPPPKPGDYLNLIPTGHDDDGEATKHNIRVLQLREQLEKEKKNKS